MAILETLSWNIQGGRNYNTKKAEAEAVFNATKKFEEHKFYEHCLKMPNIYEQLLNGKTTNPEPSQSF